MADAKISALAAKTTPASADLVPIVDVSDTTMAPSGTNKKATVAQLAAAVLASPALTGTPTAPTAAPGTNTTQVATTAFVLANAPAGGSGTVTTVSASVPAGLSVAVTNPTTTPAIAVTTTLSGVLKGTGSGFAAAVAGTDYVSPSGSYSDPPWITGLAASKISGTVGAATVAGSVTTISGLVAAGTNVSITGSGTSGSPYTIAASGGGGSIAPTSSILKGDGAGAAVAATAGTDYPGLASANTFTAQQIFLTGASGGSPAVFRQTGGTAGTNEVQVYHDGTDGHIHLPQSSATLRVGVSATTGTGNGLMVHRADLPARFTLIQPDFNGGGTRINASTNLTLEANSGSGLVTLRGTNLIINDPSNTQSAGMNRVANGVISFNAGAAGAGTPAAIASSANTPAQITANTNDYSPGVGDFQRWNASGAFNVTGMVAGAAGERREIHNVGSSTITLTHQDAASVAANRWRSTTGASLALAADKVAQARYDAITAAWRVSLLP